MSEQRVVSSGSRSVGGIREGRPKPGAEPAEETAKKSRKPSKKILIIAVAVVLVVAGAAYFFLLKPAGSDAPAAEPEPIPGEVLTVEAVSVNLEGGHYLRLGLGLQLVEGGGHGTAPDPAKALDLAIALFSGRTVAEVADPATREALKVELAAQLSEAYHGDVMDVYLTDYVTQ